MLTEEQMFNAAKAHILEIQNRNAADLIMPENHIRMVVRAIAEWLQEVLIWEGEGIVYDLETEPDRVIGGPSRYQVVVWGDDDYQFTRSIIAFECPEKKVRVYVVKDDREEGDGSREDCQAHASPSESVVG